MTLPSQIKSMPCHTVGQIPKKCKETSNLMCLSSLWFISFLFVCWNLFCTIANLRIKCVTESKHVSVLFFKNLKSSFLHGPHICLWGFFTFLVDLAHGVARAVGPLILVDAFLSLFWIPKRKKVEKIWVFLVKLHLKFYLPSISQFICWN